MLVIAVFFVSMLATTVCCGTFYFSAAVGCYCIFWCVEPADNAGSGTESHVGLVPTHVSHKLGTQF